MSLEENSKEDLTVCQKPSHYSDLPKISEKQRVFTSKIVTSDMAPDVAKIQSNSTSATLRATISVVLWNGVVQLLAISFFLAI